MSKVRHITRAEIDTVIELNNAIPRRTGVLISGSKEEEALVREMLNGGPPEKRAFLDYLLSLSKEKINELAAVMLWGRDAKENFDSFECTVKHCSSYSADDAAVYISGKRLGLSQYLMNGVSDLNIR